MNTLTYQLAHTVTALSQRVRPKDATQVGTRVLMFHDLNTTRAIADVYSLPVEDFTNGMKSLAAWATKHSRAFVAFSGDPRPGVAVTFDDGYKSTLTLAAPILCSLGIPFHVFLTKSYVETNNAQYLNPGDVRELAQLPGASVGLHGTTHERLTTLDSKQVHDEISQSHEWLQNLVGRSVTSLSYPHGDFNDSVTRAAQECGLTHAACSKSGTFADVAQRYAIPRIDIWSRDSATAMLNKTLGAWDSLLS